MWRQEYEKRRHHHEPSGPNSSKGSQSKAYHVVHTSPPLPPVSPSLHNRLRLRWTNPTGPCGWCKPEKKSCLTYPPSAYIPAISYRPSPPPPENRFHTIPVLPFRDGLGGVFGLALRLNIVLPPPRNALRNRPRSVPVPPSPLPRNRLHVGMGPAGSRGWPTPEKFSCLLRPDT